MGSLSLYSVGIIMAAEKLEERTCMHTHCSSNNRYPTHSDDNNSSDSVIGNSPFFFFQGKKAQRPRLPQLEMLDAF